MPGLSIVRGGDDVATGTIDDALDAVTFLDGYRVDEHVRDAGTMVAHTGYDAYPVRAVEGEGWTAVLEGYVHDTADPEREVRSVVRWLRAGDTEKLRSWLREGDKEFLLAVADHDAGEVTVLTDVLGRFPTYSVTIDGTTVVSRELKFVRRMVDALGDPVSLDRLAVAQQLLFGYTLGTRTPFEGVEQLPPGARIDVEDGIEVDRVYRHDFEGHEHADRSSAENAEALASRFLDACRRRSNVAGQNVVSLSGGLDSRAVAAGFARTDLPAVAATFQRVSNPEPVNTGEVSSTPAIAGEMGSDESAFADEMSDDAEIAEEVAAKLGIPWTLYQVSDSARVRSQLLDMKQGTNYLEMAFILEFFERLQADHGSLTYLTGDGGDKVLADLTAGRPVGTDGTLAHHLVETNSIFPPEEAARIAGIDTQRLLGSVRERVRSYPESDHDAKHVHFLIRERGMNWLTHGEDRNRYYFPSLSPFYAWPVFEYAMNCPPEQKQRRGLYREFLSMLSPEIADVEYANFGASLSSLEYRVKHRLYDELTRFPSLKRLVVSQVRRKQKGRREELRDPEPVRALLAADGDSGLNPRGVESVLERESSYSDAELARLHTVVALATGETAY
ncbi:asparagine synthase-related protein [Halegenticoccus tardaugens]|uniref:asparagine synthase-related protein n=1 Tax=Halegenticoccus tardaugens TaxID=2071624 RepID=UPI00100A78A9|nr:asparagine synthase C-terminal domain-containing protein [Halegenticoccus tardaugens]